ncbi:MAG: hypothetical protein ABII09_01410 [Planctomycetota bacterium]
MSEATLARILGSISPPRVARYFGGKNGIFGFLFDVAFLPLVGQFFTNGDTPHTLFNPAIGVPLGLI